jgi:hypothetical protein
VIAAPIVGENSIGIRFICRSFQTVIPVLGILKPHSIGPGFVRICIEAARARASRFRG